LAPGTPSASGFYPCGRVYGNVWHLAASPTFLAALRSPAAYGGSLEFSLVSASGGDAESLRPGRGTVVLTAADGRGMSFTSLFPPPRTGGGYESGGSSSRSYVSAVLREDSGWVSEPDGAEILHQDFHSRLQTATELLIRGDLWSYGGGGRPASASGQEVVHFGAVTLRAPP
ncbi:unnamed protein product, partial [Phaeothamnion confervicola]